MTHPELYKWRRRLSEAVSPAPPPTPAPPPGAGENSCVAAQRHKNPLPANGGRLAAVARRVARNQYSTRQPSRLTIQGSSRSRLRSIVLIMLLAIYSTT